jgi:hypothetical protein
MFFRHRVHIIELTLRSQVPSIFGGREYVAAGGLMSYLSSNAWHWRSAADQPEDRKGARHYHPAIAAAARGRGNSVTDRSGRSRLKATRRKLHSCYQAKQFIAMPPNPSLNADVPHAGLRPRSGPPVSSFR